MEFIYIIYIYMKYILIKENARNNKFDFIEEE